MENYDYDVFISYSSENTDWAQKFAKELKISLNEFMEDDIRVFIDTSEIHGGEIWMNKIMSCVENCITFVAIYSPEYFKSNMCRDEFATIATRQVSLRDKSKLIFPILHKTCHLKARYSKFQYLDFTNLNHGDPEYKLQIEKVAFNLQAELSKRKIIPQETPIQILSDIEEIIELDNKTTEKLLKEAEVEEYYEKVKDYLSQIKLFNVNEQSSKAVEYTEIAQKELDKAAEIIGIDDEQIVKFQEELNEFTKIEEIEAPKTSENLHKIPTVIVVESELSDFSHSPTYLPTFSSYGNSYVESSNQHKVWMYCEVCNCDKRVAKNRKYCPTCETILRKTPENHPPYGESGRSKKTSERNSSIKVWKYCRFCDVDKRVHPNKKYCPSCDNVLRNRPENHFSY